MEFVKIHSFYINYGYNVEDNNIYTENENRKQNIYLWHHFICECCNHIIPKHY